MVGEEAEGAGIFAEGTVERALFGPASAWAVDAVVGAGGCEV
jgi:hypothetical protein